jgi:hypothetical protein
LNYVQASLWQRQLLLCWHGLLVLLLLLMIHHSHRKSHGFASSRFDG